MFYKLGVLKNFTKIHRSLLLNKVTSLFYRGPPVGTFGNSVITLSSQTPIRNYF